MLNPNPAKGSEIRWDNFLSNFPPSTHHNNASLSVCLSVCLSACLCYLRKPMHNPPKPTLTPKPKPKPKLKHQHQLMLMK